MLRNKLRDFFNIEFLERSDRPPNAIIIARIVGIFEILLIYFLEPQLEIVLPRLHLFKLLLQLLYMLLCLVQMFLVLFQFFFNVLFLPFPFISQLFEFEEIIEIRWEITCFIIFGGGYIHRLLCLTWTCMVFLIRILILVLHKWDSDLFLAIVLQLEHLIPPIDLDTGLHELVASLHYAHTHIPQTLYLLFHFHNAFLYLCILQRTRLFQFHSLYPQCLCNQFLIIFEVKHLHVLPVLLRLDLLCQAIYVHDRRFALEHFRQGLETLQCVASETVYL